MRFAALTQNTIGMLALCAGILLFSVQDAIIKGISGDYAVTQAIVIRSLVSLPILLVMVQAEAGLRAIATPNRTALMLRGAIMLVAYTTYYMALPALPLAEAIALFFVSPIFVTLLAGPILGETVGWRSWAAVLVGFGGVLCILQPGSALFEPAALLSLVSAAAYATAMVHARRLGVREPATVMAFYQNAVYLLGALAIASVCALLGLRSAHPALDFLVRPWVMPGLRDFALMAGCGVIAAAAMSLLTQAYKQAEAALVTVFEYTGMIWAPLWGYLFFAEVPKLSTVAGMALIVAAGLYALRAGSVTQAAKAVTD